MSKVKPFKTYLETRLNQAEIQELEEAARIDIAQLYAMMKCKPHIIGKSIQNQHRSTSRPNSN